MTALTDSTPAVSPRRGRALQRMLAVSLAVVAAIALVEIAVRIRQWWKYGTTGSFHEKTLDPASGLELYQANYVAGPMRINSLRFRGPEIDSPKPTQRIRIAFLGGSTTLCAEATRDDAPWPAVVARKMREAHPGSEFDYVNGGVGGFGLGQCQINLEKRVRPLAPDVIVIYEATNDLTHDTREIAKAQGLYQDSGDDESWLAKWLVSWRMIEFNLKYQSRIAQARRDQRTIEFDPHALAEGFRKRLLDLVRASQQVAPVVAVATFSHQARRDQSPEQRRKACESSQFYMPWMSVDGLMAGFEEYNRAIRDAAKETGALLIEGEDTIPGDSKHFADSVHLTDLGCVRMADRVFTALDASEGVRRLIAERKKP